MNTLETLWYTYILPSDRKIPPDSAYAKKAGEASEYIDMFWSELSREGKRAYDQLCYKQAELAAISECEQFALGFRLGAGIMMELLEHR